MRTKELKTKKRFGLKKIIMSVGLVIFLSILGFVGYFVQLQAFLPHKKIQIILPFDAKYDSATSLIPMGETIYHPKPKVPKGHPGIDFGSQVAYPFIASADGMITKMNHGSSDGIDIYLTSGAYSIVYKEMDESKMFVKVGQKVKQGDKIAYGNPKHGSGGPGTENDLVHYSVHWEFASASFLKDRYCPVNYFTEDSRKRIEAIWANVKPTDFQDMKQQFPEICSGDYAGVEEK